jgi:DNA-binding CsgD family transcriptional regulator
MRDEVTKFHTPHQPDAGTAVRVRTSRRKKHHRWEQLDQESDGRYATRLRALADRLWQHKLTISELRGCVWLQEAKSSVEIASALGIDERSVERYRTRIHSKLGLPKGSHLAPFILSLNLSMDTNRS